MHPIEALLQLLGYSKGKLGVVLLIITALIVFVYFYLLLTAK